MNDDNDHIHSGVPDPKWMWFFKNSNKPKDQVPF